MLVQLMMLYSSPRSRMGRFLVDRVMVVSCKTNAAVFDNKPTQFLPSQHDLRICTFGYYKYTPTHQPIKFHTAKNNTILHNT